MRDLESMAINCLRWGVVSDDTSALQSALEYLGYGLPKYGIDGKLGTELEGAVTEFCADHGVDEHAGVWVGPSEPLLAGEEPTELDLSGAFAAIVCQMADDVEGVMQRYSVARSRGLSRSKTHGYRKWTAIDTIVLHQAGVWIADNPERLWGLKTHVGVLRGSSDYADRVQADGPCIVLVHNLSAYLLHAHSLNAQSVSIEVNGKYDGVHGGEQPDPPQRQIAAARQSVRFVCDLVAAHGGQIRNILPHRVSSMTRRSDPGEAIWKGVGRWAQDKLGLSDGGPGFTAGGLPIPEAWDPRYTGEEY